MSLLNCADCNNEIATSAGACPRCGSKKPFKGKILSAKDSKGMSYKERRAFQKAGGTLKMSFGQKLSFAVLVVFGILIFKALNTPLSPEEQAKKDREQLMDSARYSCQFHIEKHLNDPSSVEYGRDLIDRIVVEEQPGKWTVQLKLRAKNKFNATVPAKFVCHLIYDGKNFHLVDLKNVKM